MKKITVATNPEYQNPRAPLLWIELPLANPPTEMGVSTEGQSSVHHMPLAVCKRAKYGPVEGNASALIWEAAQVHLPRLRFDISDPGLAAFADLGNKSEEACRIAADLDATYRTGSEVSPMALLTSELHRIVGKAELIIENGEFLFGAPTPAPADKCAGCPDRHLCK